MSDNRLITLAIHTYDKALALKNILESEGVIAVLNNVNLENPTISSGIRVRIYEKDLPLALRIVENPEIFTNSTKNEDDNIILVPVDFSEYSYRASLIAFKLAAIHKFQINFLHSYIAQNPIDKFQYTEEDFETKISTESIKKTAEDELKQFSNKLKEKIKIGVIPPIKFTTKLVEGVPEDSIENFAKERKPQLIIMGTRGSGKKEKELIGSVTGEVLDVCRIPVLAVPENANSFDFEKINHIVFFCNMSNEDFIALDTIYRLLPNHSLDVTILTIPQKTTHNFDSISQFSTKFLNYCRDNYPRFTFKLEHIDLNHITSNFKQIEQEKYIDLIIAPNKKKNVFSRFFNPSLAHKILLHSDIPLMTIPV